MIGEESVVMSASDSFEICEAIPRHRWKVVMLDMVTNVESKQVCDAIVRVCRLKWLRWIMLLDPSCAQGMQADAAYDGKREIHKRRPTIKVDNQE